MLENGMDSCNCPKTRCKRHGRCQECIEHHAKRRGQPYCKKEHDGIAVAAR